MTQNGLRVVRTLITLKRRLAEQHLAQRTASKLLGNDDVSAQPGETGARGFHLHPVSACDIPRHYPQREPVRPQTPLTLRCHRPAGGTGSREIVGCLPGGKVEGILAPEDQSSRKVSDTAHPLQNKEGCPSVGQLGIRRIPRPEQ